MIDDDGDARDLMAAIVARAGYTVMTARDGREALDLLNRVRPSVIFVDLWMPVMNGHEFREAQRRNRVWLTIPTVVMTGTSEEPLLDLAIEETLQKPVKAKQVIEIVRRHAGSL
ncbi:MAG: response regulator [Deltaproteobacteria bacterium]|nr:response regulator [Deltaproteobacteria bacterium]